MSVGGRDRERQRALDLESGELKVAGVQWSIPGVADYKTDPDSPTGFW